MVFPRVTRTARAGSDGEPLVSVLMPTYRQEAFLPRALSSLIGQSYRRWHLVVVDDGSGPDTDHTLRSYDGLPMTYHRHHTNAGLGVSLTCATALAEGDYLAYLPSDDVWERDHLRRCVELLESDPGLYLVYGGVRWHRESRVSASAPAHSPHLRDDVAVGRESDLLDLPAGPGQPVPSGNLLALVQVVHRRDWEDQTRWPARAEIVSDSLEADMWRDLLRRGARFGYTGHVTCEWGDHPDQRHKIISGRGRRMSDWRHHDFGLSHYRQHYGVPDGVRLNWQPVSGGIPLDETARYRAAGAGPDSPRPRHAPHDSAAGLKIVVAGSLGFNPDRILALAAGGHRLFGLWMPRPHFWDTAGPLPFTGVETVELDDDWVARIRRIDPDVIYGLLNWPAIPFLHDVRRRLADVPFVFHFKESPFTAMQAGYWSRLRELVRDADAVIFSSEESREWFRLALGHGHGHGHAEPRCLVIDGDLPPAGVMREAGPVRRLSDRTGEIHTVCVGRTFVEDPAVLARHRIHVHVHSHPHTRYGQRWLGRGVDSGHVHLHDPVEPSSWAEVLARYDAGWLHVFDSGNHADLRFATWDDLNTPARLATYAAGGLPWLMRANRGHRVAVNRLAARWECGIAYDDCAELAELLHDERRTRAKAAGMLRSRHLLCFDTHVDTVVELFRSLRHGVSAAVGGAAPRTRGSDQRRARPPDSGVGPSNERGRG